MKKIRILQVNKLYHPWIGGVEKIVQQLAEGLKDRVDMKVLTCQSKGKGNKEFINEVEVIKADSFGIYLGMPVSFKFPFLLKNLSKNTDIIHIHSPFPLGEIACLITRPKVKIVVWWHSDILRQDFFRIYSRLFQRVLLKRADKVFVATPNHISASKLLARYKQKCAICHYGIDVKRYFPSYEILEKSKQIKMRFGPRIILFVGRLIYYKGLKYLIKAMRKVDGNLLIIGTGNLEPTLKNMVNKLALTTKVFFAGNPNDDDLIYYYHACDLFCLPSIANTEAFGIVQLEAMACGKAVINTNLPTGVPYVSIDGNTGITVPPRNSTALAEAINKLLADKMLREKYGNNAFKRVQEHFTLERMIDKIYQAYKEILNS